jgi:hypothetical protein
MPAKTNRPNSVPDPLAKRLLDGAEFAQYQYEKMNTGWMPDAPESFLQNVTAMRMARNFKGYIDVETSKRKIEGRVRGRPASDRRKRSDIAVYWKTNERSLRAIIEVKIMRPSSAVTILKADREKLKRRLKQTGTPVEAAYMLVYADGFKKDPKKRKPLLEARFQKWANALKPDIWWRRVILPKVKDVTDEDGKVWGWGFAVYKFLP